MGPRVNRIVLIGSSGHAKVAIDILKRLGTFEVVGLLDRFRSHGAETCSYKVLGDERDLPRLVEQLSISAAFIAIGDNFARAEVARNIQLLCPTIHLPSLIHPNAVVAGDVVIGDGSILMAGAVVNSGSTIGRFCILNTNCSLDHDSSMNDFASLAPGVATGGNCRIDRCAAVGIGAVISRKVSIGEHAVIGTGATVLVDVAPFTVALGTPARPTRTRKPGEPYL